MEMTTSSRMSRASKRGSGGDAVDGQLAKQLTEVLMKTYDDLEESSVSVLEIRFGTSDEDDDYDDD